MKWLREAISDDGGLADMAYISIGALTTAAIASLVFVFAMSAISYHKCEPITTISKGDQSVTSVIPCNFDPLPVGQAAGLVFGAFAALIGALAGYMAATRRPRTQNDQTVIAPAAHTVLQVQPAEPAVEPKPEKAVKRKR